MAEFNVNCPHCNQEIQCNENHVGAEFNCPACQKPMVIPQVPDDSPSKPPSTGSGCGGCLYLVLLLLVVGGALARVVMRKDATAQQSLSVQTKEQQSSYWDSIAGWFNRASSSVTKPFQEFELSGKVYLVTKGGDVKPIPSCIISFYNQDDIKSAMASVNANWKPQFELVRKYRSQLKTPGINFNSPELASQIQRANADVSQLEANLRVEVNRALQASNQITAKTDSDGKYSIKFPKAGVYVAFANVSKRNYGQKEKYCLFTRIDCTKSSGSQTYTFDIDNAAIRFQEFSKADDDMEEFAFHFFEELSILKIMTEEFGLESMALSKAGISGAASSAGQIQQGDNGEFAEFYNANVLYNQHDYDGALKAYTAFINKYPSSSRVLVVKELMADIHSIKANARRTNN